MILQCYICIFFIVSFLEYSLFVSFAFFKIPGIVPVWRPSIICSHMSMIHCQLVSHWLIQVLISQIRFRTPFSSSSRKHLDSEQHLMGVDLRETVMTVRSCCLKCLCVFMKRGQSLAAARSWCAVPGGRIPAGRECPLLASTGKGILGFAGDIKTLEKKKKS